MPKTIERTVYTFDELTDSAKDRARDWYREGQAGDPDMLESSLEDIAQACESLGVTLRTRAVPLCGGGTRHKPRIDYSIGDRGEYVAFEGTYSFRQGARAIILAHFGGTDGEELSRIAGELQAVQRRYFYRLQASLTANRESMSVSVEYDGPDYRHVTNKDAVTIQELLQDVADWARKLMSRELEYQNSDEVIDETILANEYTFDEHGNREG